MEEKVRPVLPVLVRIRAGEAEVVVSLFHVHARSNRAPIHSLRGLLRKRGQGLRPMLLVPMSRLPLPLLLRARVTGGIPIHRHAASSLRAAILGSASVRRMRARSLSAPPLLRNFESAAGRMEASAASWP